MVMAEQAEVRVHIENEGYTLKNLEAAAPGLITGVSPEIVEATEKGQQQRLPEGILTRVLQVAEHVQQQTANMSSAARLTEAECEKVVSKALQATVEPNTQDLLKVEDRIVANAYKIQELKQEEAEIVGMADRRFRAYLLGSGLVGLLHLGGFGYMIFGVEWLGWDIIEPLTYTISQLGLLLGWRFFLKNREERSFETIQQLLRRKSMGAFHHRLEQVQERTRALERENELMDEFREAVVSERGL